MKFTSPELSFILRSVSLPVISPESSKFRSFIIAFISEVSSLYTNELFVKATFFNNIFMAEEVVSTSNASTEEVSFEIASQLKDPSLRYLAVTRALSATTDLTS